MTYQCTAIRGRAWPAILVGWLVVLAMAWLPLPVHAGKPGSGSVAGKQAYVADLIFVSSRRVSKTVVDNTYRIRVVNPGPTLDDVTAYASTKKGNLRLIENEVALGRILAGASVTSSDTFTLRIQGVPDNKGHHSCRSCQPQHSDKDHHSCEPQHSDKDHYPFQFKHINWKIRAGQANTPPVANAGPDQNVFIGSTVTLDGSRSTDADADELSYAWNFRDLPASSTAVLSDPTQVRPTFLADQPGRYKLDLTVFDGTDSSAPDTVVINTDDMNSDPVANAGPDQNNTFVGIEVALDGSASSDIDGDPLSYQWAFQVRPPGSSATLSSSGNAHSHFTPDIRGEFILRLTVADGRGGSSTDYMVVSTEFTDRPPIANAGPDQSVLPQQQVLLDGSLSSDPDNDAITSYSWSFLSRPDGSVATLQASDTAQPSFVSARSGDYVIQLVVTANGVASAPDTVTVTTANVRPVANAGPDQTASVGSDVGLDGNASADANNDPLSFDWSLLARPDGSAAVLSLGMTPTPRFTADRAGEFVVQLVVNDGHSASDPDTAVITATSQNRPPVAVAAANAVSVPTGTTVLLDGSGSSDPDGDTLTYQWSLQVPAGSSAVLSAFNQVNSSFVADQAGSYVVTLVVRDAALESGPSGISVTATAPNRAPTAAASANPSTLTPPGVVNLDGSGSTDPDGDTLAYQWSLSVPAGSAAALSSSSVVAPNFSADIVGEYMATLVVSDGVLASAPTSVTITATRDNLPPTLIAIGDRVSFLGETLAFRLFATDPDAGDVLTFSLLSGPTGMGVNPTTGDLAFTPAASQVGTTSVTARVTDSGGLFDDETFALEVRLPPAAPPANAPPTLAPIANRQLTVGQALSIQTVAADPDAGDTLTYSMPSAPAGMTISGAGLIGWMPQADQLGPFDVTVQVVDTQGAAALQNFIAEVRQINRAPQAVDNLYDARIGETTSIGAPGVLGNDSDPDGDALSAALVSNATKGVLDFRGDGSFDYTPGMPRAIRPVELEVQCSTARPNTPFQTNGTVAVGDVDNDGQVEIVGIGPITTNSRHDLWILNASDCTPELTSSPAIIAAGGFFYDSHPGLLDIDGDGDLEIIAARYWLSAAGGWDGQHLMAVQHDGTPVWVSETSAILPTVGASALSVYSNEGPTFSDLDGNGTVEIIMTWRYTESTGIYRSGLTVYNSVDGSIVWEYTGPQQEGDADYKPPVVADLDLDGTQEIIVHTDVVSHLGILEFRLPIQPRGATTRGYHLYTAVANFDSDPYPEIVAHDQYNNYLYNHDGTLNWQIAAPNSSQSQITVADLDGDGEVEFAYNSPNGTGGGGYMMAYDTDGSLLWSHAADPARPVMGTLAFQRGPNATAFDANKDGAADLVIHYDDGSFVVAPTDGIYIFDGRDGSVLSLLPIGSYTGQQGFITIADIDDDGEAEIIGSYTGGMGSTGITVVWQGTNANPLPSAPSIRNQWVFNPAYVDDRTGAVLTDPVPHWSQPGLNGYNLVNSPNKVYLTERCGFPYSGLANVSFNNGLLLTGDFDNDGDTEIAGFNDSFAATTSRYGVWIINGSDCSVELQGTPALFAAGRVDFQDQVHLGAADLDGDGDLEFIGRRLSRPDGTLDRQATLLAVHHDGQLVWPGDGASESSAIVGTSLARSVGPSFADLDADGSLEILLPWERGSGSAGIQRGVTVFDARSGTRKWEFVAASHYSLYGKEMPVIVADLDLDGTMEVIVGASVVSHEGVEEFVLPQGPSGLSLPGHLFTAVANFDDDPFAEIVGRDQRFNYLYDHTGQLIWQIARVNDARDLITVGNFDNDPAMEYAYQNLILAPGACGSSSGSTAVFDTDGTPLWNHDATAQYLDNCSVFNQPTLTAYDANSDGIHDLVVNHRGTGVGSRTEGLYIFDGADGSLLEKYSFPSYSETRRAVTIADVDQDGEGEIVLSWESGLAGDTVVLEGTASHPLPPAPVVVNQQLMHYGLVGDDGQVITNPVPQWLKPGANGFLAIPLQPSPLAGTTDSFTYVANDGALNSSTATVTFDVQPAGQPPVFLTQPDTLTTVGFPYEYAPRVVDADPGDSVSFTLVAAPAGMTMSTTGRLNWSPQAEGRFQVSIIASDTIGFATPQSFTLVVGQAVVVPNVIGQPQAAAQASLAGVFLLTGSVRTGTHPTIAAGSVFDQAPPAGAVTEFGGRVDLFVSTGAAPEDVDNDGDGFSESQGDCDDSNASIAPGAADAPGDGIDSDCDGIDGNLTLTSILVAADKSTILTDQTATLTATGIFSDGSSQNLTSVVAWTNGPTFSYSSAGTFTITAARGGVSGSTTIQVRARVAGDAAPPVSVIATPAANSIVTEARQVTGTATDGNFLRYELAYAPAGVTSFTTLATGLSPVTNGPLGEFDPTLLINDTYTLRLTVFDLGGNQTVAESTVQVDGNMKVGNFTLRFTDLQIPMAGIPITVTRTYDSRDKVRGDFGVGWRLDVNSLRIRSSRDLGTGWRVDRSGLVFALAQQGNHSVSLTLADGKVETFDLVVSPSASPLVPFPPSVLTARFVPRQGTLGSLQSLDNNTLTIFSSQPGQVELSDDVTGRSYNPTQYRYTSSDGVQIVLSTIDGVRSVRDRNGNTLSFTRNGISHSAGKSVVFERDELGRIVSITDPNGSRQEYGYDANDDLRTHLDPTAAPTRFLYDRRHYLQEVVDSLGNRAVRNEYDDDGRLIASIDALGNRVEFSVDLASRQQTFTDSNGNTEVASFDSLGNVVQQERIITIEGVPTVARTTMSYDLQGNQTSIVDPDGMRREFTYDSRSNLTALAIDPLGQGLTSTHVYDSQNRIVASTEPSGLQTSYEYDGKGNLLATRNQLGHTTSFHYDQNGRQIAAVAANGSRTETQYTAFGQPNRSLSFDASGRMMSRIEFEYDGNGNNTRLVAYANPANSVGPRVTTRVFDAKNRVTQSTDAQGNLSLFQYDSLDRLIAETDSFGNRTEYVYNSKGDLVATRFADGSQTSSVYDASGNEVRKTDQLGRVTNYAYDEAGRAVATTSPAGTISRNVYTPGGRLRATVDESGNRTEYEYDAAGRRTIVRLPAVDIDLGGIAGRPTLVTAYGTHGNVSSTSDPNGNSTAFEYDAIGRQVRTVFADGSSIESVQDAQGNIVRTLDQLGLATDYEFDGANRLVRVIQPAAAAGSLNRVSSSDSYDSFGNLVSQTDGLGRVTRLAYNALGRVTERVLPGGQREVLAYDRGLRLSQRADFDGAQTLMGYDGLNRETSRQYSDGTALQVQYTATGQLASMTDAAGEVRYVYDDRDNLVAVTQPDGTELSYAYTSIGQIGQVLVGGTSVAEYTYDAAGRMTQVTTADGVTEYGYDLAGNQTVVRAANGTRTERQFDNMNRVSRIRHFAAGGGLLQDLAYSYDARGMRLGATEVDGSAESYQYDQLNRLVSRVRTGSGAVSETHEYDSVGNRTQSTGPNGTTSFVYDVNDRLIRAGSANFGYDASGNRLSRSFGGRNSEYAWDARGRLESVTLDGTQTRFNYDALGNRTLKHTGADESRYVVDSNSATGLPQVVQTRGAGGQVVKTFVHGTDLLAERAASGTRHYHQDVLGSTSLSTDTTGQPEGSYRFGSFGVPETAGSAGLDFGFTGEQYDAETGLQYLRARYYDPATGVFLSQDPLLGELEDPVTRHRYLYAASNPANFTDPTGESFGIPSLGELQITQAIRGVVMKPSFTAGVCLVAGAAKNSATLKALSSLVSEVIFLKVYGTSSKDAKVTLVDIDDPTSRVGINKLKVELTGKGILEVQAEGGSKPAVKFSANLKTGKVAGSIPSLDVPLITVNTCGFGLDTSLSLLGDNAGKTDKLSSLDTSGGLQNASKRPVGFRISYKLSFIVAESKEFTFFEVPPGGIVKLLNDMDRAKGQFLQSRYTTF